ADAEDGGEQCQDARAGAGRHLLESGGNSGQPEQDDNADSEPEEQLDDRWCDKALPLKQVAEAEHKPSCRPGSLDGKSSNSERSCPLRAVIAAATTGTAPLVDDRSGRPIPSEMKSSCRCPSSISRILRPVACSSTGRAACRARR